MGADNKNDGCSSACKRAVLYFIIQLVVTDIHIEEVSDMIATAETLRKLDSLNEQDFNMIVSLIDRLSISSDTNNDLETFRQIRKRTSQKPMTEDEVEAEVAEARKELYATNRN